MLDWLQTRGRAFLSLLSDLGGALGFIAFAAALIAAAATGAALLALEVFPQPFLSIFVLGVGLLAAGLTLHFLRGRLTPPQRIAATPLPAPLQQREADRSVGRVVVDNPYSRAAAMQRQHDEAKIRKAIRRIREELRDNRRHVQRADEGENAQIRRISLQEWRQAEEVVLGLADPEPHSAARQAYRELEGIQDVLYIRESPTSLRVRSQPRDLLETDVQTTLEAIDRAIEKLGEAEGRSTT